jgi:hypothetical protein
LALLYGDSVMGWIILALIALYPCELSESDMAAPSTPAAGHWARHADPAPPADLQSRGYGAVNKKLFLEMFEQQAGRDLMPCLRQAIASTGTLSFLARLHKTGEISGVRVLNKSEIAAECIPAAIEKMSFRQVGETMHDDNLEINWRFDW